MKHNIFTSTKHWKFTRNDEIAEEAFIQLEKNARSKITPRFYQRPLLEIQEIRKLPLYQVLKTIPKGVMHHSHYYANDDVEFLRLHVLTDARIYLSSDLEKFEVGTIQQWKQKGWISMREGVQKYGQKQWLTKLGNLIAFSQQQMLTLKYKSRQTWVIFQRKILTPLKIYFIRDIFQKYTYYYLQKYIRNGYDRIQMRSILTQLSQYDTNGNFLHMNPTIVQKNIIDNVLSQLNKKYPLFTFGFICVGFKIVPQQETLKKFRQICDMNWDKLIGFDFVQQQDKFDSLEKYDKIVQKIFGQYPHLGHLKKIYHAGETSNHLNDNIDVAVKAGSVRLGHGINILQRAEFLTHCKNVCFEKNPISNLLLGYNSDLREASAPILLGLGHAVSISPDDPGKFGLQDSTGDYFSAAVSYNWTLRHLKLVGYHSINHAVCQQNLKKRLIVSFEKAWDQWVVALLPKDCSTQKKLQYNYEDIFTFSRNWNFSEKEQEKNASYIKMIEKISSQIPENTYQQPLSYSKDSIKKSDLYQILKTMPKGTLQSCHLFTNHDSKFFLDHVLPSSMFYYNAYTKQIEQCSQQQGLKNGWMSSNQLMLKYETIQEAADFIYSITSFTKDEIQEVAGHAGQFWKLFTKKYKNLTNLLSQEAIFRKYVSYTLQKLANLGYERVEFRMQPIRIIVKGEVGQNYNSYLKIIEIIDQQYENVRLRFPTFTIGFIILGNKQMKDQQNHQIFDSFCSTKWDKIIGFDFFQNIESQSRNLSHYDSIINSILQKYDDRSYEKFYQAGNTNDHTNQNLSTALKSGSIRILNGLSITQDISLLKKCGNICFEMNPILNVVDGASNCRDVRLSNAPILLGLGFPVTINSYFSGILGLQDPLFDLFFSALSFNFTLKHLKLIILHSINYSCCTKGQKQSILKEFHDKWTIWMTQINVK